MLPIERFEHRKWLARVWAGGNKRSNLAGTAFAITPDVLVTCAHVVLEAGVSRPGKKVFVDFPLANQVGCYATVLEEAWQEPYGDGDQSAGDIALLRLDKELPIETLPLAYKHTLKGLSFDAYGFTYSFPNSDIAHGKLGLRVGLEWVRVEADSEAIIQRGFSGAPVWSEQAGGAVAMILTRQAENIRVAYAVPLSILKAKSKTVSQALENLAEPLDWLDRVSMELKADVIPYRGYIEEKTMDFTGREFVFSAIESRLNTPGFLSGYIIIQGEPGIGKSALMSQMARNLGYVHHFNIFSQGIHSHGQFLRNVCAQLVTKYSLPHKSIPNPNSQVLHQLLKEAATVARERGEAGVVVLIDALDESEEPQAGMNRLYLPQTLPEGVYVIMSIRKNASLRVEMSHQSPPIILDENSEENERDIKQYIQDFCDRHQDSMAARLHEMNLDLAKLWQASEGNFMYLRHVLPDIRDGKSLGQQTESLPQGLAAYYERHWSVMRDKDRIRFRNIQQPVLCVLATAREAVSIPKIEEWINNSQLTSNVTYEDIEDVFLEWAEFLEESPNSPPRYRLYHNSFLDFLSKSVDLHKCAEARTRVMIEKIDWDRE